jgi:hypothetical protein
LDAFFGSDGRSHRKSRVAAIAPAPEVSNEFAEDLRITGADVAGSKEQRSAKHQVRYCDAGKRSGELRGDINWRLAPELVTCFVAISPSAIWLRAEFPEQTAAKSSRTVYGRGRRPLDSFQPSNIHNKP